MKKIIIFGGIMFLVIGSYVMSACSLDKIQQGKTCAITTQIQPIQPTSTNMSIPNPNKDKFAPNMNKSQNVQDLGTQPATQNNSPAGPYNSGCQFGVCPPKINNNAFNK